ncbi:MAG: hypothetical protein EPO20_06810 [Betaproteobacteria bacterium]|nr:MAG: hypothetical protein EPO20_06810 [Betaproteobacteria bacterium]
MALLNMHADFQAQLAFHLTGQNLAEGPQPVAAFEMIPALLARYRNLAALRYDFPLVLSKDGAIHRLSTLVDEACSGVDEKTRKLALNHERGIRAGNAKAWNGPVPLAADGELADCDAKLPGRLVAHVWRALEEKRSRAMKDNIERLKSKLSDILAADDARSDEGRSAQTLRASFGGRDDLDFEALSGLLKRALPARPLPASRKRRIESLLKRLGALDFGPFVFDNCAEALAAYRARLPQLIALSKAIAAARLEAAGEYVEARHDEFFERCGASLLGAEGLADFPGTLVQLDGAELGMAHNAQLAEMLALGMPVKVLVQFDDILHRAPVGRPGFALRSHALAGMALGLQEVYVLQCCASSLYEMREDLRKGLEYPGAAVFSVFSGAGGESGKLPAYLVAAAAAESRVFPALRYDPSLQNSERFSLAGNPQADKDWALRELAYEDAKLQTVREEVAFTLADFAACDGRYAGWFARVPKERTNGGMVPVRESVAAPAGTLPEKVPYVLLADGLNRLHKAIVADELIGETRRCLEFWRSLQERVHKKEAPVTETPKAEAPAPAPAPAAEAEKPARNPDEPSIETPRCSTCEECVKINNRMFAYDANKQAYIADLNAGTYRELVEAAENCQVSIIHPGKPRNAQEPGLEELIARAEPFL